MCSVPPSKQSLESISFDFSHRHQELPSQEFLADPEGLTYSLSFLSASKQSHQQLPLAIQVDHERSESRDLLFPKIQRVKKYQANSHSKEFSPHCLNIVLQSVKCSPRNRYFNETEIRYDKKGNKGVLKKKESFSLPHQSKKNDKINRERSKTMLNLSALKFLREQQENYSPKKAQTRKKEGLMMKKKLKEHTNTLRMTQDGRQEPFELLCKEILAKKMSLGHNWELQKKYLRKITQKRQTVRPCFPFILEYQ